LYIFELTTTATALNNYRYFLYCFIHYDKYSLVCYIVTARAVTIENFGVEYSSTLMTTSSTQTGSYYSLLTLLLS